MYNIKTCFETDIIRRKEFIQLAHAFSSTISISLKGYIYYFIFFEIETHYKCLIHLYSCHMHALDSQVPDSFVLSRVLDLLSLITICSFQWGRPSPLFF